MMKSRKTKSIVMLTVLLAVLAVTGLPQAQAAVLNNLKQLGNASTQEAGDALTVGLCILSAANQNLAKLDACGEDIVCRSAILLDTLLETLLCTNPDDPNLALYACISDAIVEIAEIRSTCGDDRACALQKLIPVVINLTNCFGQDTITAGN
jgi:hypothetical protein